MRFVVWSESSLLYLPRRLLFLDFVLLCLEPRSDPCRDDDRRDGGGSLSIAKGFCGIGWTGVAPVGSAAGVATGTEGAGTTGVGVTGAGATGVGVTGAGAAAAICSDWPQCGQAKTWPARLASTRIG